MPLLVNLDETKELYRHNNYTIVHANGMLAIYFEENGHYYFRGTCETLERAKVVCGELG